MNKEILKFGDCDIEKRKFHYSKYPIYIKYLDIDSIFIQMGYKLVTKMIMIELTYCV